MNSQLDNTSNPSTLLAGHQRDPSQLLLFVGTGWPGQVSEHNGLSVEVLIADLSQRGYVVHHAQTTDKAIACLQSYPIGAVLLDLDYTGDAMFRLYELMQSAPMPIPTLLMGSPAYRAQSMQPRALGRYDEYVRIDEACTLKYLNLQLRGLLLRAYPDWEGPTNVIASEDVSEDGNSADGELVCVFSSKGGTGKTTVATNLAVGLAQLHHRTVALIDGDLYFGDVDVVLNVQPTREAPRRSLGDVPALVGLADNDWSRAPRNALSLVDSKVLDQILFKHPSGISILLAPPRPETAERIPHSLMRKAVDICRRNNDFTIIDMPSSYSEAEIELMDIATRIVVVLKPEMSSLRNTNLFLEYAESFGWKDKLILVLNRADSERFTKISREQVEKHLGRPTVAIVSSGAIPQAVSEGAVVLTKYRGAKVAQGFEQVLNIVDGGAEVEAKASRSLFGLLGRRLPRAAVN